MLAPLLVPDEEVAEGALEELLHPAQRSAPENISGNANCFMSLFMIVS
jgi:hypothetical protein